MFETKRDSEMSEITQDWTSNKVPSVREETTAKSSIEISGRARTNMWGNFLCPEYHWTGLWLTSEDQPMHPCLQLIFAKRKIWENRLH